MKGRNHFSLAVGCAGHMVRSREHANSLGSAVRIVKPNEVARIEVDHNTPLSRSSLIVIVESVPPRRCLRWARKSRVNLGLAKNGLAGTGFAGTIFATRRPRSVTRTSSANARLTHRPVA